MTILKNISFLSKYLYIPIGVVLLIVIISLLKEIKQLSKVLSVINNGTKDINNNIVEIKEKIAKIQYTLDNSVPLFAFLFFILMVIISAIQDYKNTKRSKRNFVKSSYKQYGNLKRRFHYQPNKKLKKNY